MTSIQTYLSLIVGSTWPYLNQPGETIVDHKISSTQRLIKMNQSKAIEDSNLEDVSVDESGNSDSPSGNEEIVLEPLKQNPYEISYTCLLLPRLDSHYLLGEVADHLQAVIKQISTSYGWHLEFLSVKPEYLHWAIRVPPSTSTTHVINVVRKQTSQQLFLDFPRFKRENQSDDFWAPGYLIFWGSQPHPIEIVQRYILQTRKQQGISMDE